MHRFVLITVVAMSSACSITAGEITVGFWNVENLFDEHKNPLTPEETVFKPGEVKVKLEKDARVIRDLNADILGLAEVEHRGLLQRLVREQLAGTGYEYFELIEETGPEANLRGIDVGLISKRPFLAKSFQIPGMYRGILACRFTAKDGEPFYVLVNHWKSRARSTGDDAAMRVACANRVIQLITEELPRYEGRPVAVAVVGDFNDDDSDPGPKRLEEAALQNTLKELPKDQRWTLPFLNYQTRVVQYHGFDHIFVNKQLQDGQGVEWVPNSSVVVRPKYLIRKRKIDGKDYDWPDDDIEGRHIGYSDHFPVVTRLRLPD